MRERQRIIGGFLILVLLFIVAVTVALTTPVFNITSVTVVGNERISAEEAVLESQIPIGKNIYRVSMKNAEERLRALPYVETVKVKRRFPARVLIRITERQEAVAVECPGGYAVVDKTARVLRVSGEEESLPRASGAEVMEAVPGEIIQTRQAHFPEELKTMLSALEAENIEIEIAAISIRSSQNVMLETRGGMEIHLGNMDELSYKLKLCGHILRGGHAGINKDSRGVLQWTDEGKFSYRQNKN